MKIQNSYRRVGWQMNALQDLCEMIIMHPKLDETASDDFNLYEAIN